MKYVFMLLLSWLMPLACNSVISETFSYGDIAYHLKKPDQKITLKSELEEISALSYVKDGILICIQDENGIIYFVDINEEEVTTKVKFGKKGDYEGIEVVGNSAYVLRSDGTLFEVINFTSDDFKVNEFVTPLNTANDTEGLSYIPKKHSLLIACKENAYIDKKRQNERAVYQFNLKTNSLDEKPFILIDEAQIASLVNNKIAFHPSGIAQHPITQEWYIIASKGKLLVVVDKKGNIIAVKKLHKKIFKQPEGICFAPDGTLFISNEGKGGKGNILRFEYNNVIEH